jgi:hypothetical protein
LVRELPWAGFFTQGRLFHGCKAGSISKAGFHKAFSAIPYSRQALTVHWQRGAFDVVPCSTAIGRFTGFLVDLTGGSVVLFLR